MRICSLLPSATEIIYALGLGDSLVAVTHECDYPLSARTKPIVVQSAVDALNSSSLEIDKLVRIHSQKGKSIYSIDLAKFRESDPDLVLTQELCAVCAVDYNQLLEAIESLPRKPKILSLAPSLLSDVLLDIARVAEATGKEKEGATLLRSLRQRIDRVRKQTSRSKRRLRVLCLEWLDPIYSAGHWVPGMVELAGGRAGLAREGERSARIDWPSVLEFSPEVIVLMPCGMDVARALKEAHLLRTLPGWNELPAVKAKKVFAVNGHAYFSRPGPRLAEGLELLAQMIHPENFSLPLPPEAAQRIL